MKSKLKILMCIIFLVILLLVTYKLYRHYSEPLDYEFTEIVSINEFKSDMRSIYFFKISMTTKGAFIPHNNIGVAVELNILDDEFLELIEDQDMRLIFQRSFETDKDPNLKKLGHISNEYALLSFSKKLNALNERISETFFEAEVGQVLLHKIEKNKFYGEATIMYKAPGTYGYVLMFNRGQIDSYIYGSSFYKVYLDKIPIGTTTDLLIKRTNEIILILMVINLLLILYDILGKKK